jgi:hypothetical protein
MDPTRIYCTSLTRVVQHPQLPIEKMVDLRIWLQFLEEFGTNNKDMNFFQMSWAISSTIWMWEWWCSSSEAGVYVRPIRIRLLAVKWMLNVVRSSNSGLEIWNPDWQLRGFASTTSAAHSATPRLLSHDRKWLACRALWKYSCTFNGFRRRKVHSASYLVRSSSLQSSESITVPL